MTKLLLFLILLVCLCSSLCKPPQAAADTDFSLGLDIDGGVDTGDNWRVSPGRPAFGFTSRIGLSQSLGKTWTLVPEVTVGLMRFPPLDTINDPQRLFHIRGGLSAACSVIPSLWIGARAHVGYAFLWGPADTEGVGFDPDGFSMSFGGVVDLSMSSSLDVGLHFDYGALLDRASETWIGWLAPGFHVGMRF